MLTGGTVPGPRHKYYISDVGGGGVSDHALILLMQCDRGKPVYVILELSLARIQQ